VFADLLRDRLRGMIPLSQEQVCALERHHAMLTRWNKVLNLTAVRDLEEAVARHYCESLYLGTQLPAGVLTVADVGTGGGFPGVPVAILRPDCTVCLIESHQRKAVFLRESSRELQNVRVLAKRAEEVREEFNWVVCRAVKFGDVGRVLARLAPNLALLGGEEEPGQLKGLVWAEPVRLPWGARRYVWVGNVVSREVSRETQK